MTVPLCDSLNTLSQRRIAEEKPERKGSPGPSAKEREAEQECSAARVEKVSAQEEVDAAEEASKRVAHSLKASGADVTRVEARLKAAEQEMARLQRRIERCVAEGGGGDDEGSDEEEQARRRQRADQLELIRKAELDEVRTLFKPPQVAPVPTSSPRASCNASHVSPPPP